MSMPDGYFVRSVRIQTNRWELHARTTRRNLVGTEIRGSCSLTTGRFRTVRLHVEPTHVERILSAFEEQGWPSRLANPLPETFDLQQVHQAVHSLNQGLQLLRFSVQEGGQAIRWSRSHKSK